jgi:hypothetical protein
MTRPSPRGRATTLAGAPGDIGLIKRTADSQVVGLRAPTWNGEVMMGEITAAGGKYSLRFSEGLIESIWRPGSVVDVEDARLRSWPWNGSAAACRGRCWFK